MVEEGKIGASGRLNGCWALARLARQAATPMQAPGASIPSFFRPLPASYFLSSLLPSLPSFVNPFFLIFDVLLVVIPSFVLTCLILLLTLALSRPATYLRISSPNRSYLSIDNRIPNISQ